MAEYLDNLNADITGNIKALKQVQIRMSADLQRTLSEAGNKAMDNPGMSEALMRKADVQLADMKTLSEAVRLLNAAQNQMRRDEVNWREMEQARKRKEQAERQREILRNR